MRKQIIQILVELRRLLRDKFNQYNEHLPFLITIIIALLLVVGAINVFIDLTATLQSDALAAYDEKVTNFIASYRQPALTRVMTFITHIGDVYGYLIITTVSTVLFFIKFQNWRYVIEIFFVLIVSGLSNVALKQVINRARPDADHLVSVASLSYPSGHAMSAIAFYGFLIYIIYNIRLNNWVKTALILIFSTLILGIGLSRIYLGVHYPSDVAGGYIAGFIWVIFCVILFHSIDLLRNRRRKRRMRSRKA